MKPSLTKRLELLEARPPTVDTEHMERLRAAIGALFESLEVNDRYGPSKQDPMFWRHHPGTLTPLWQRIQSGTVTEDDRTMMAAWPKCHLAPEQLVALAVKVRDDY